MVPAENTDGFSISLQPAHGMTILKIAPPIKRFKASAGWPELKIQIFGFSFITYGGGKKQ